MATAVADGGRSVGSDDGEGGTGVSVIVGTGVGVAEGEAVGIKVDALVGVMVGWGGRGGNPSGGSAPSRDWIR